MRVRLPDREPVDYSQADRATDTWPDHRLRVAVTGAIVAWLKPNSVLDPACGDGAVVRAAWEHWPYGAVTLGDASEPNIAGIRLWKPGPWAAVVADATDLLAATDPVQLVILTEFLEHVPEPEVILGLAREKATQIVVSSPEMRPGQHDINPEHLWMFDGAGYEQMLVDAGWKSVQKTHLTFRSEYDFQIWTATRA